MTAVILLGAVALFGLAMAAGIALVVRDTARRSGRWGINLQPIRCPRCGLFAPAVRIPKSRREAIWGGWTWEPTPENWTS